MELLHLLIPICTLIIYISSLVVHAQQFYIGDPKAACNATDTKAIYFGYSCNEKITCDTMLTFRSQSPYNTPSTIASLLGVDPDMIIQVNPNTSADDVVESDKLLYVPVTCSCQNNDIFFNKVPQTTYPVAEGDEFYDVAHKKYQGLTTCTAILSSNREKNFPVPTGTEVIIPLRCACPTISQKSSGIKSLETYVVGTGDTISSISTQLKVDNKSILQANNLEEGSNIYPSTTLLIPVMKNNSAPGPASTALSKGAIGGIVGAVCAALLAIGGGAAIKFKLCGSIFSCFNCTNNIINVGTNNQGQTGDEPKPPNYRSLRDQNVSSDHAKATV